MSKWNLTYKGAEAVFIDEWNRIIDALNDLDTRIKGGVAKFSGDGTTKDFNISHGFSEAPTIALIGEGSADAIGSKWWEVSSSNIVVHFSTAPPSGTENVVLWWLAIML